MDIDARERNDELFEERKAADGKPRKMTLEVTEVAKVTRNNHGQATSAIIKGRVRFKGDVTLRMHGNLAAAYWSVTPGMRLVVLAIETGDKVYDVEHIDLLMAV